MFASRTCWLRPGVTCGPLVTSSPVDGMGLQISTDAGGPDDAADQGESKPADDIIDAEYEVKDDK